jgi:hypothetical protein
MILTTRQPSSGKAFAVGVLKFSVVGYDAAIAGVPGRWSEKTYLPYVGSKRSMIVSWRDAFPLERWMKKNGKKYLPGARYGIVAADRLLRKILDYFDGKRDQTDKFLENVHHLECQLKREDPNKWADYQMRKTGTAGKCTRRKNKC